MEASAHHTKEVRWGFLSTARIGKQYVEAIKKLENQAVVAVASRSLEKAKEWAEAQNVPKYYGSYDEILNDPEVNAVYIPLPVISPVKSCANEGFSMPIIQTGMHCEWTIKAAKAGKHVLCEKPFAQTAEEVNQMIKACDENNVALMDGKYLRFRNSGSVLIIADSRCDVVSLSEGKGNEETA